VTGPADADPKANPRPAKPAAKPGKRNPPRSARRRSREIALQGLYEWLLSGAAASVIDSHMREQSDFDKCDSAHFDALLHGCIVRGETYHFELVANESGAGVSRVALDHEIPIANAILTVENEAQAWDRVEEKGRDAARVAVEMANLMDEIE
jgi:hypothetical protein